VREAVAGFIITAKYGGTSRKLIVGIYEGNSDCACADLASKLLPLLAALGGEVMADEKDRFGETMKLVERAKEDIYFAERDRELIEKFRNQMQKVEKSAGVHCPKCPGLLETYTFQGFVLDRCQSCGGIWMDKGELEGVLRKVSRGLLGVWIDKLTAKD
jgi:hypothetical protein